MFKILQMHALDFQLNYQLTSDAKLKMSFRPHIAKNRGYLERKMYKLAFLSCNFVSKEGTLILKQVSK